MILAIFSEFLAIFGDIKDKNCISAPIAMHRAASVCMIMHVEWVNLMGQCIQFPDVTLNIKCTSKHVSKGQTCSNSI